MAAHTLRERFKATVAEAILDAAETLAAEEGVAGAGLSAIAKRAGIAVGTIYNHFADRNELFTALFERRKAELLDALDTELASAKKTFDDQLAAFLRASLAFFDQRRNYLRIALEGSKPVLTGQTGKQSHSMTELTIRAERIVKLGQKEKRIRGETAALAPWFLIAALRSVLTAYVDRDAPLAGELDRVVLLFEKGALK